MNNYADPKPIRYRNNGFQSGTGMRWYRTEIPDAGMPMLVASASMPMPSYDTYALIQCVRGVWGYAPQTDKYLLQSPCTGKYFQMITF